MIGYTVYIYHITPDDANRVRRELGMAELPCGSDADAPAGTARTAASAAPDAAQPGDL